LEKIRRLSVKINTAIKIIGPLQYTPHFYISGARGRAVFTPTETKTPLNKNGGDLLQGGEVGVGVYITGPERSGRK
jgi:hypothetical protein